MVTLVGLPALHSPDDGAVKVPVPFADPQAPFTGGHAPFAEIQLVLLPPN